MMTLGYIIVSKTEPELAWSNTYGWCDETFDTFTQEERETLNLPIDGEWLQVPWACSAEEDA